MINCNVLSSILNNGTWSKPKQKKNHQASKLDLLVKIQATQRICYIILIWNVTQRLQGVSLKSVICLKSLLIIWLLIVFKLLFNWHFVVCCDWSHLLHARLSLQTKNWNLALLMICFTDRAAQYQRKLHQKSKNMPLYSIFSDETKKIECSQSVWANLNRLIWRVHWIVIPFN